MNWLFSFFKSKYISIFFLSMLPVTEVKGSLALAAALNLNPAWSVVVSLLGSSLIVVILTHLFREILMFLKTTKLKNWAEKLEDKVIAQQKTLAKVNIAKKYEEKNSKLKQKKKLPKIWQSFLKSFSVFLFVILPLPGTGVYMGSMLASILKLNKTLSCISVIIANLIVTIITQLIISGIILIV